MLNHNKSKIFEILEDYFNKLDNAPISPNGMFTSESDKERYETSFLYAFRKYQAARYHYRNVKQFIETENAKHESIDRSIVNYPLTKFSKSKFSQSYTADHYVSELSAFLAALKSSIDFICAACSPHLIDIELDSVRTLIKLVKKGKRGPILDVVRKNIEWLEKLRSYRDNVVHRRIFSTSSGHETHLIDILTKMVRHPKVIPKSPPSYVPDTRKQRMIKQIMEEDVSSGLGYSQAEVRIRTSDGKDEIFDFSIEYFPSSGFVAIEDFMKSHLDSYEEYFTQILQALTELEFKSSLHR